MPAPAVSCARSIGSNTELVRSGAAIGAVSPPLLEHPRRPALQASACSRERQGGRLRNSPGERHGPLADRNRRCCKVALTGARHSRECRRAVRRRREARSRRVGFHSKRPNASGLRLTSRCPSRTRRGRRHQSGRHRPSTARCGGRRQANREDHSAIRHVRRSDGASVAFDDGLHN